MTHKFWFVLLLGLACGLSLAAQVTNGTAAKDTATAARSTKSAQAEGANAQAAAGRDYIIGNGDLLAINVWKEAEISRVVPVRPDGKISLPLIGELQASGRTPRQLQEEIAKKLKDYVAEPEVNVIVQEIKSQKFNVLGMVMHPGSYTLTKPMTVIDAIAMAGGFRDFAKQKDVYVLRRDVGGKQNRLPFNYKDVIKGRSPEQNVELQSDDTVVVP
ncbi:MAG: polysaccharide biosynthesis/export family protein [Terriglobales bacterium]